MLNREHFNMKCP